MKILNRGFISIKPKALFLNWKADISNEEVIEAENLEATVYLIEDDFWEDEAMIKKYFKKIATQECFSISEDKTLWPVFDEESFQNYFEASCGTFVIDLMKNPIDGDKLDL